MWQYEPPTFNFHDPMEPVRAPPYNIDWERLMKRYNARLNRGKATDEKANTPVFIVERAADATVTTSSN